MVKKKDALDFLPANPRTQSIHGDNCCASPDLILVVDAIAKILEQGSPSEETESIEILNALGRVLASDIVSSIDVPGYDNSAMDGYAVIADDCSSNTKLHIAQRIPAGTVGASLDKGSAARIFTGAPIPENADAVVMQEQCEENNSSVIFNCDVKKGQNIRKAGEDIEKGSVILPQGGVLRSQELGLLASIGINKVEVYRKLRVAVFFTGDELVLPGAPLGDGKIYNSNQFTLCGLLEKLNCEVINLGVVPDKLEATLEVVKTASTQADLIITSGGVSVGDEDYVRVALERLGQLNLWRIAMKPGKPVAFGKVESALFIGLPGNPVSIFVTFLLFARPLIMKMQGCSNTNAQSSMIKAGFNRKGGNRQEYLRARLENTDEGTVVKVYPHQGSGVLSSACWADGLVEVKMDQDIMEGDMISYMSFKELL